MQNIVLSYNTSTYFKYDQRTHFWRVGNSYKTKYCCDVKAEIENKATYLINI